MYNIYEHIDEDDVELVNSWLDNLVNIGYQFPSVLNNEYDIPRYELDKVEEKDLNEETCEPPELSGYLLLIVV